MVSSDALKAFHPTELVNLLPMYLGNEVGI